MPASGLTVHQYLENEKRKIIDSVQAALNDKVKRLRAEFENGKAELEKEVERLLEEEAGGEEGAKGEATNQEAATVESGERAVCRRLGERRSKYSFRTCDKATKKSTEGYSAYM